MKHISSKTRNLLKNGDNLSLSDLKNNPDSDLYNQVMGDIVEERKLGENMPSPDNKLDTLKKMAGQFDKQKAEEAVEQRREDLQKPE
ncbi:hypothetical protein IKF89_00330 [Candidatus Saccharibacteria bacterium]|nr:hypothetical protein [Candidatus Saccharibacteria bacterium]